jgi:release factor glutamine methyltransferase
VATEDLHTLPEDVLEYEPKIALDGGPGGFGFFYAISSNARKWLKPGGLLAVEIGAGQARNVEAIFASDGHADVNTICDYNGIGRIVYARAK